jgi:uncharacterized protein YyaL (SSP411 family)
MVEWEPWGREAFARAVREQKPVLLSIHAAWCQACHDMDRATYADPAVADLVRRRFVPVRVDADHRPDINERYNLGGWPTTAFLTASARLIAGGTYVAAGRMASVLAEVADTYASRAAEWADAPDAEAPATSAATDECDVDEAIERVYASFDDEYGGFGLEPKFPHAAPLRLAMALARDDGEARWRAAAERTLDAMWDGLWDAARGGFCRYAATRDWQQAPPEKLLDTNAALLGVYADAAATLGRPEDRDRTGAIAAFITGTLADVRGGYFGSDADRVLYADANAAAASALFAAAGVLDDAALSRQALASFERVLLACYRPGGGIAHEPDGVRGLLADQVAAMAALLDAHDLTGGEPYAMMAEELGHFVVARLAGERSEGFVDRVAAADDIGLLRSPRTPFVANAEAAVVFARLQRVSREYDFGAAAAGALRAAARLAGAQGPLAAHYVLAARQLR